MAVKIQKIKAREILDSRGNPTVEAEVFLSDASSWRAAVPAGASMGSHEALELRDGDRKRFGGLGVLKACRAIEEKIAPAVSALDPANLPAIDKRMIELDGTLNKSGLGANATLAVSFAMAKAGAHARARPLYCHLQDMYQTSKVLLPVPLFNVINGGRHANNQLTIQEFMLVPGTRGSFREALREACEVFRELKVLIAKRKDSVAVGDEGGFAPGSLKMPREAMDLLMEAIQQAGYAGITRISLDMAASEFYSEKGYGLIAGEPVLSGRAMTSEILSWCRDYPIVSIEDPLFEDDWSNWTHLTKEVGSLSHGETKNPDGAPFLVGDDLFVTNPKRLKRGFDERAANAILIKPNQIGTVTETAEVVRLAREHGYLSIASHRSGETEDVTLAHVAVGLGAQGIKTGSVTRSERLAKYNELLRLEENLGEGHYLGSLGNSQHETVSGAH
ncbi:MAG: phosphopyruvate hydratase [Elusimicrobia bacterium]|nr:phosphopyruvate hydratase [Elusimicrobiota bacterium]